MKTESASVDHFAGLQEIADHVNRLRNNNALMLAALKRSLQWLASYPGGNAMNAYDAVRAAINEVERAE